MNTLILSNDYLPLAHKIFSQFLLSPWCFQKATETQFQTLSKPDESSRQEEGKKILCKTCQHPITASTSKIVINATHYHRFNNPAGFTFEIGCFFSADGCAVHGIPTLEHTWFKGFAWRYALCAHCHNHLGWFYQTASNHFYGLILNQLQNEEC